MQGSFQEFRGFLPGFAQIKMSLLCKLSTVSHELENQSFHSSRSGNLNIVRDSSF